MILKFTKNLDCIILGTRVYADSGYQGFNNRIKNAKIPINKSKKKQLSYWQKYIVKSFLNDA